VGWERRFVPLRGVPKVFQIPRNTILAVFVWRGRRGFLSLLEFWLPGKAPPDHSEGGHHNQVLSLVRTKSGTTICFSKVFNIARPRIARRRRQCYYPSYR
jgi:hypothetical protein